MFSLSLEPVDPRIGFSPSPTGGEATVTIIDNDGEVFKYQDV